MIHWPAGIKAKDELREQFHHVIDVVPTILEACKIPAPTEVNGIQQKPIEGVSMLYSFENKAAEDTRKTQYFEMLTNRAIHHDGWVACSRSGVPWETGGRTLEGLKNATWELYNVDEDFSQANDLAATNPAKLKALQDLFLVEAKKYNVLPLDPRMAERFDPKLRIAGEQPTSWTYFGNQVRLPEPIGPQLFPSPFTLTAEIEVPESGAEGVITCAGAFSAGWSLYVAENKPVFRYNCFDIADKTITTSSSLEPGPSTIKLTFTPDGTPTGGGTMAIMVNDKPSGEGKLERTLFRHGLEPFEIGRDSITPVDPAYQDKGLFEFTGTIKNVQFKLE